MLAEHLVSLGHSADSAQNHALALIASIEGAIVLSRAHQSTAPLDAVLVNLPKWLAR